MSNPRYGIIDCGTNTFNLLIAEWKGKKWKFLLRRKKVVKLGSQGIRNRIIGPEPAEKAVAALRDYRALVDQYKVKKLQVFGTAALRDASNGPALLRKIKASTGFKIELIDGNREATLIYKGVSEAMLLGDDCSLIMDIGGGSTEFILCNADGIFWKKSYRLGAARLLEIFHPSDPMKRTEMMALEDFLAEELVDLGKACAKFKPGRLIGSSGSFDTFAAILLKKQNKPALRTSHYKFSMADYRKLHKELEKSTYKERLLMPGMLRMRADMILLASVLLTFVLQYTQIQSLHLSTYALKEGALAELKPSPSSRKTK